MLNEFSPTSGIVLRRGGRWGAASLEWARLALSYAGPLNRVWRSGDVELALWGRMASWEAPDGARIWGGPTDEIEHRPVEEFYRDGAFTPELPIIWPYHQFVKVGPGDADLEMIVGRFYPRGSFYAERRGDLFFAPEFKAFSSVRSTRTIRPFPRGHRIAVKAGDDRVAFERACEEPEEPVDFPPYEIAVRRCRELLEQALDEMLSSNREPYVLALSGGMDSSMLAYMLASRGLRPLACNVWFDRGRAEAPRDVLFAREVAKELGLELHEIRVGMDELKSILLESFYIGEPETASQAENATYHIPLLRELTRRGIHQRLTANGIDNAFAGYPHFRDPADAGTFRSFYHQILDGAKTRHIPAFNGQFGMRSLAPFRTTTLLKFALGLPMGYLIDREAGQFRGKRIVRDAFQREIPSSIIEQDKRLPGGVNDAAVMLSELFGGDLPKERAIVGITTQLLEFMDLKRVPAWAVRWRLGDYHLRKRRRKAEIFYRTSIVR